MPENCGDTVVFDSVLVSIFVFFPRHIFSKLIWLSTEKRYIGLLCCANTFERLGKYLFCTVLILYTNLFDPVKKENLVSSHYNICRIIFTHNITDINRCRDTFMVSIVVDMVSWRSYLDLFQALHIWVGSCCIHVVNITCEGVVLINPSHKHEHS